MTIEIPAVLLGAIGLMSTTAFIAIITAVVKLLSRIGKLETDVAVLNSRFDDLKANR